MLAKEQVQVFPQVTGKIVKKLVEEGQWIEKGTPLVEIDRDIVGYEFERAKVESPISGTVGKIFLDEGASVAPQVPIALVFKIGSVKVMADVAEKDISKIRRGAIAKVSVDAYSAQTFKGTVTKISPMVDLMSRTASVEITVANPGHKLKPGMFANVELVVGSRKDVAHLPQTAVLEEFGEEKKYAFVIENNKAVRREVKTGLISGDLIEIKTGIEPGELVVVKGQHYLKENEEVEIVKGGSQ